MTSERPNNKELFEKYQETRSIELRNKIVEKYLYIVDILIKKYLNKGVDYEDLYQVGSMALVFAVERYDVSKGYEFTSFATPTIIGEIKRYFRDKGWAVKVPRRLKEISAQIPPAKEYLYGKLNRTPTIKELSEYLGIEEGLKAITINAAEICNVADRIGSLEVGKDADIAIFNGNPMDIFTVALFTIINGEIIYRSDNHSIK
jgi:RNA polymerase sigma factor (sigma-70 family)